MYCKSINKISREDITTIGNISRQRQEHIPMFGNISRRRREHITRLGNTSRHWREHITRLGNTSRHWREQIHMFGNISRQRQELILSFGSACGALNAKLRFAASRETCFYLRRSETLRRTKVAGRKLTIKWSIINREMINRKCPVRDRILVESGYQRN
jgi:hypothetical protein